MSAEEISTNDTDSEESASAGNAKNGNFLSKYGKFFLIAMVLLVQTAAAYAIINSYYDDIYHWMDGWTTEGNIYHTFENIIVNPANSDGNRYLLLSIAVEVNTEGDAAFLENQSAKLIDKMNLLLSKHTVKQLADVATREEIKQELGIMINDTMDRKAVRNLFFTKYVLQ